MRGVSTHGLGDSGEKEPIDVVVLSVVVLSDHCCSGRKRCKSAVGSATSTSETVGGDLPLFKGPYIDKDKHGWPVTTPILGASIATLLCLIRLLPGPDVRSAFQKYQVP